MQHRVKETLTILILLFLVALLTAVTVSAQPQKLSPAPNCYKSGYNSGYQKGYNDGFDIGYRCLIPSIHYPAHTNNPVCTGSSTDFDNGFKAGYRAGYNTGFNAGSKLCLQ